MNQSCLSFGFIKGTLSIFNPWRGGWPSRMLEGLSYHNQYRKGRGRGNPRGSAPLCRGARDLLVPGISFAAFMLLLSSTRESRPGYGAERPYKGGAQRRACHPRKCPREVGPRGCAALSPQSKPKTSRFIKYDNIFMIDPPAGNPAESDWDKGSSR